MNIRFRPLTKECIPYRIKWLSSPRVVKYLGLEKPKMRRTRKTEGKWFDEYEKSKKAGEARHFAICDGKNPIGIVGFSKLSKINKSADLFIIIGNDDYTRKGISKIAMRFILDYGFNKLGLHKVSLGVFEENIPALKLYKKIGFKVEGKNKDEAFFDGRYHDFYNMAIFNKKDKPK
jgi:RimJ/RimL family protein N-acetyltransferase